MSPFGFFGSSKKRRSPETTQGSPASPNSNENPVISFAKGFSFSRTKPLSGPACAAESGAASVWFDPAGEHSEDLSGSFTGQNQDGGNGGEPSSEDSIFTQTSGASESGIWKRGVPVTGLLQRYSIRGKLFLGIVMLVVTIITLTVVGLYGFYRYRDLADAISERATELPMATHLSQWAATARDSNTRICQMKAREGMIDSSVLAVSDLQLERAHFAQAMLELSLIVNRYGDAIGVSCSSCDYPSSFDVTVASAGPHTDLGPDLPHGPDSLKLFGTTQLSSESTAAVPATGRSVMLIDTDEQRASLKAIGQTIHDIERMRQNPRSLAIFYQNGGNELSAKLARLFEQTNEHLGLIHGQMAEFSDHVRSQHRFGIACSWGALFFATVVTLGMIVYFQWMVIGPFSNLVSGARLVASGEYGHTIDLGRDDEIGELAGILNQMTDRFRKSMMRINDLVHRQEEEIEIRSREVIRNEQLAGVGFLAAGFAHEINNPMAAIAWSAESLESNINDLKMVAPDQRLVDDEMMESLQENLQRIEGEAYRCKSITERMLSFSRVGHVKREIIDVVPLVNDVVELVGTLGKYECENISIDSEGEVMAYANSQEIRQVVLNLVTNAMESVDASGSVTIRLRSQGPLASIAVLDTGCGMSKEVMQHLFEPFYTRRRDGSGTGLGLSISYRIVCQHGGQLIPRSAGVGLGSTMELRLPVDETGAAEPKPIRAPSHAVAWRETAAA